MKKRKALAILVVFIALISVYRLKQIYPELTWPVINNYTSDPEAPSANGSPYKIYYQQLEPVEKQAYNMIMDKIYDMPEKILVPDLTEDQLDNVFRAVLFDNPDLFFVGRKCSVKPELWNSFFEVEYIVTKDEYYNQKRELDKKIEQIIATLPKDSEYNTELAIHDYIVNHTDYKMEDKQYVYSSIYGCLVNGVAACEGYSKSAKILMDKCGIESYVISGIASLTSEEGGPHMWNIVNIDNSYYHLDCTWDDPITEKGKQLKLYTYFNVPDSVIKKTHSNFSLDLECISSSSSYYEKNNLTFDNYSKDSEEKLASAIHSQYRAGIKEIQLNFVSEASYNKAIKSLITNGEIYKILSKKDKVMASKIKGYYSDEDTCTLTLVFN